MCESYVQPYSKPCSSAFCISSISRVYGGSGRTVTPKLRAIVVRAYAHGQPLKRALCETGAVIAHFLAFLGVSAVVIVTPGQDTALTIRNTLVGGRRDGVLTALGVGTGQCGWAVATSAGLAALLLASGPGVHALRRVGPAYLVYLGLPSLYRAVRKIRASCS